MKKRDKHYKDFSNRRPYNDVPCKPGEVLVPFVVDWEMVKHFNMNKDNLETWKFYGKKVLVAFTPAAEAGKDDAMKIFNRQVHEFLNQYAEQTDDLSLDKMLDDMADEDGKGKYPTGTESLEDTVFLGMVIKDLIAEEAKQIVNNLFTASEGFNERSEFAIEATEDAAKGSNEADEEMVTYRRVQGGTPPNASRSRINVDDSGNISIPNKTANLNISTGDDEHVNYFLNKRGPDAEIVEFDVPKWFDDFLNENAILQNEYKSNPLNQGGTAPKIVDPTTPGTSYELPAPWIEWVEEYGTSGRK